MKNLRFAVATALATFALLLVGGTVNPTGSSLACPDWPWCYGSFFPEMTGGVEFEHTHRLVASAVGLMTFALTVMVWRNKRQSRRVRALAMAASVMVLLQGVLGGLTVLLKLPTAISVAHLALSMFFFSSLLVLCWWIGTPETTQERPESTGLRPPRLWVGFGALAVYLQILLGGLVRHTESGRACGDSIPFCYGELWPVWGPAQLNMLHRWAGVAVFVVLLAVTWVAYSYARRAGRRSSARLALALPLLVLIQFGLGLWSVSSNIGVVPVTAHLGVGALLLANTVLLYLSLGPAPAAAAERSLSALSEVPA